MAKLLICMFAFWHFQYSCRSKDYKRASSWLRHYSLLSWMTRCPHLKSKWSTFRVILYILTRS